LNNFKFNPSTYANVSQEFNVCGRDDTKTPPIPDFDNETIFQALIDYVVDVVAGAA